jgi:hypothetical protein
MSSSDPHFSRPGDGAWEPGFLEGGKMHTFHNVDNLAAGTQCLLNPRGVESDKWAPSSKRKEANVGRWG